MLSTKAFLAFLQLPLNGRGVQLYSSSFSQKPVLKGTWRLLHQKDNRISMGGIRAALALVIRYIRMIYLRHQYTFAVQVGVCFI